MLSVCNAPQGFRADEVTPLLQTLELNTIKDKLGELQVSAEVLSHRGPEQAFRVHEAADNHTGDCQPDTECSIGVGV
jgi:hypothetical protein